MSDYDNDLLKRNINKLKDEYRISQDALAKIAKTSQPRLCKLLGDDKGSRFSIEQVYLIAQHFGVSIEYLITGKEPEPSNSTRNVCQYIVALFENFEIEEYSFDRIEQIKIPYTYYDSNGIPMPELDIENKSIKYHALFFPNCWKLNPEREYTKNELDEKQSNEYYNGNEIPSNIEINKFLDAFIPIHKLYSSRKMPKDAYEYTVNTLLNAIK